jgi:Zn-dependent protease/CBS domain-containing protein
MSNTLRLGSIAGIPIQVHYTWLFAFFVIAWSLAGGFFPSAYRGWAPSTYWIAGIIAALGLFASVVLHELSHSLVARARGLRVHSITLFIFGGVSSLADEAASPKDEFLISVVGPLTSFLLGAVFWGLLQVDAWTGTPVGGLLRYLAFINLLLGAFNLVPGFPLDGGRVLRSIIWGATGNLRRATDIASYAGQAFGLLFIFWGATQLVSGNMLGGLWTGFIGWFLNSAAISGRRQVRIQEGLRGVRVAQVMDPDPMLADPDMSIQSFVVDHVMRRGDAAVPVVDNGRLVGIATIADIDEVPQQEWRTTPVRAVMTPVPLNTASPDMEIHDAIRLLDDSELRQLPVVQDRRLVGLLSRADILRFMRLNERFRLRPMDRRPEREIRRAA